MLKFYLLGRPFITLDEQPVTAFASEKELLLLCYLLANPGEHSRPQLAGMLWGEMTEERARANLSTAVYNLRQLFPEPLQTMVYLCGWIRPGYSRRWRKRMNYWGLPSPTIVARFLMESIRRTRRKWKSGYSNSGNAGGCWR
jgi:hypothetical protein